MTQLRKPITLTVLAATAAVWFLLPALGAAQTQPGNDDLRALRFYIEANDTTAIDAELRRLRAAFPGWTPPDNLADITRTGPTTEIDEIYSRIASGDIDGAKTALAETRSRFPSWTPPTDLIQAIAVSEGQTAFDLALSQGDSATAVRIAGQTPALFSCDRINNTWNLADLQASAGNPSAALVAYRQIVSTCSGTGDLVATIEKADALASADELSSLINIAQQRFPSAANTFATLQTRLMAGRGVMAPATTATPAPSTSAPTTPAQATPATTTPPAATTATTTPPPAAAPVTPPAAAVSSPATTPTIELPQPAAATPAPAASASRLAAPVTNASPPMGATLLGRLPRSGDGRIGAARAAATAGSFRDCLARSVRPRSLDLAYERAWCAYNLDRPLEALTLFSAVAAGGMDSVVNRDARFGMALAYLKRNMTDAASQLAANTDLTLEQRQDVESQILDQRGVRAYQQGDFARAIIFFNAMEGLEGSLRRDLALLRGYSYLRQGDAAQARAEFQRLDDQLATEETRTALAAAR